MVTVMIPCYNNSRTIQESIASIIQQSYRDFELLIVDDASTDDSVEIISQIRDSRIRLIVKSVNRGVADSLNLAIHEARGEFIAKQDGDDISARDRLLWQVSLMEARRLDVCGGHTLMFDGNGVVGTLYAPPTSTGVALRLTRTVPFAHSSAMLRKAFLVEHGISYSANWVAEDYQLWAELLEAGARFGSVDDVVLRYRVSSLSLSARRRATIRAETRRIGRRVFALLRPKLGGLLRESESLRLYDSEIYLYLAMRLRDLNLLWVLARQYSLKSLLAAGIQLLRGQ